MKKLILSLCIVLFAISAHSQSPIRYGIEAGVDFSKYLSADLKYATGFRAGGFAELPSLSKNMYLTSGLYLTKKGGKGDDYLNLKINAYYLELPIHLGFRQKLSSKFSLFEEVGPYVALGLFGKTTADGESSGFCIEIYDVNYNTFSKQELKRFDFGLGFKIGAEYKNQYRLAWGTDFGLIKVKNSSGAKNFNTYFSLAYLF